MKTSGANLWKLGLFVALGLAGLAGLLWWLGLARGARETIEAVTYFDESVNGLDRGAPVKFRGVRIGTVSRITFAPDQRHVEVRSEIYRDTLAGLGLAFGDGPDDQGRRMIPPGMRVQLATTGLTGIRFLLVDFFEPTRFPEPALPFEPPPNYLAAAPSTLKSLEDGLIELLDRLPPITLEIEALVRELNQKLEEIDVQKLSERAIAVLDRFDQRLAELEPKALVDDARAMIADTRGLIARLGAGDGPLERSVARWDALATRLEAEIGAVELAETARTIRESASSFRELARAASGLPQSLQTDLVAFHETLRALRALADLLERDPGALLRGGAGN